MITAKGNPFTGTVSVRVLDDISDVLDQMRALPNIGEMLDLVAKIKPPLIEQRDLAFQALEVAQWAWGYKDGDDYHSWLDAQAVMPDDMRDTLFAVLHGEPHKDPDESYRVCVYCAASSWLTGSQMIFMLPFREHVGPTVFSDQFRKDIGR